MIVSDTHRFVFIHNPKVAGTSFRRILEEGLTGINYHGRAIFESDMLDSAHIPVSKWPPELVDRYRDGYKFFGFVRSPESRFNSAVSELLFQHPDFLMASGFRTPSEFLDFFLTEEVMLHDPRFVHFSPQWSYFGLPSPSKHGVPGGVQLLPGISILSLNHIKHTGVMRELLRWLGLLVPDSFHFENQRPSFNKMQDNNSWVRPAYMADQALFSRVNDAEGNLRVTSENSVLTPEAFTHEKESLLSTSILSRLARYGVSPLVGTRNIRERNALREFEAGKRTTYAQNKLREALGLPTE